MVLGLGVRLRGGIYPDVEVNAAFAGDRFVQQVGGALLGESRLQGGLPGVDIAQLREQGGAFIRGKLCRAGGEQASARRARQRRRKDCAGEDGIGYFQMGT